MSLTIANGANPVEVWITPFGSGGGSGSATDPYSTPDADSFFNLIHDQRSGVVIPEYSTIHLLPGTFLVREGSLPGGQQRFCLTPKDGWKIRGAGMDVTILKVITNHPAANAGGKLGVISGSGSTSSDSWSVPVDNVEVSDLTVDCNLQNQNVAHCPSAAGLRGSNNKFSRLRAINWGTTENGYECFPFYIASHSFVRTQGYHNGVIEDCVVDQPAQVSHTSGGTTAFAVGSADTADVSAGG